MSLYLSGAPCREMKQSQRPWSCSLKAPNTQGFLAVFLLATWECQALAKSHAGFPTGQAKCPFCPTTLASWSEGARSATGPRAVCWRWLGNPMRYEEGRASDGLTGHQDRAFLSTGAYWNTYVPGSLFAYRMSTGHVPQTQRKIQVQWLATEVCHAQAG